MSLARAVLLQEIRQRNVFRTVYFASCGPLHPKVSQNVTPLDQYVQYHSQLISVIYNRDETNIINLLLGSLFSFLPFIIKSFGLVFHFPTIRPWVSEEGPPA